MSYGCRRCRDFSHPNKEGLWMDDLQFVGLLPVTLRLVLSVFPATILCLHYQESLRFYCLVRSLEVCGCLFVPALYFAVSSRPGRRTRLTAAALTLGWVTGPHHSDPPPPPVSLLYIKKPNRADAEHLAVLNTECTCETAETRKSSKTTVNNQPRVRLLSLRNSCTNSITCLYNY